jgi:hypothetical protein
VTQESDTPASSTEAEPPVDVSAAIAAQVFGDVPIVGPDWLRSSIAMQANFAQLLPGATALNAVELNGPRTRADREEQDARDNRSRMMDVVEEAERQREEWAQTSHSFGTTTMTGEEWGTLSGELEEGGAVRTWLLARIMRDGHTQEEAERLVDRARNVAEIMATPESQRTPEQRRELGEANRDPELRRYVDMAARQSQEMHGPGMARNETVASTDRVAAQVEETNRSFASAPPLSAHYRAALDATAPLDADRVLPAPRPQAAMSGGLEI